MAVDPRARVVGAVLFAVSVVLLSDPVVLTAALAIALGLALIARLSWRETWRKVLAMDGFILLMLLMLPFTTPGRPLFGLWGLTATAEGLDLAVAILLKANAVVLVLLALVGTLEPHRLGAALHRLRAPDRLVQLLLMTVRYVAVLRDEYGRLRTAMTLRGFRFRADRHSWRSGGYLVGMLLVRSLERAERIHEAMLCRGFSGCYPVLDTMRFRAADAAFLAALAAVVGGLVALEVAAWP